MRVNGLFARNLILPAMFLVGAAGAAAAGPAAAPAAATTPAGTGALAPTIMRVEAHEAPIVSGRSAATRRRSKLHFLREKQEPAAVEAAGASP